MAHHADEYDAGGFMVRLSCGCDRLARQTVLQEQLPYQSSEPGFQIEDLSIYTYMYNLYLHIDVDLFIYRDIYVYTY